MNSYDFWSLRRDSGVPKPEFDRRLPKPWVHWPPIWEGVFVAFSSDSDSQTYLCECARPVVENWLEFVGIWSSRSPHTEIELCDLLWPKAFPRCFSSRKSLEDRGADGFDAEICHRCTGFMPLDNHDVGDGGDGRTPYEPLREYFEQEKYRQKIHESWVQPVEGSDGMAWDYLPDIENGFLKQLVDGLRDPSAADNIGIHGLPKRRSNDIRRQLDGITRNAVRSCFPRAGQPGQREAMLAGVVRALFPEAVLLRNDRPAWLGLLELDIHLPELKLAFEHNGEQHYAPVDFFGGQAAFDELVERDGRKADLCEGNGVTLVVVSYEDSLTEDRVRELISAVGYQL